MEITCPPCLLLVMVGVAGELAVELELLLEKINWNNCQNAKLDVKFCVVKLQKEFQNTKIFLSYLVGPGGLGPGQPGKTPGERSEKCCKIIQD